jgi:hypothetical protein
LRACILSLICWSSLHVLYLYALFILFAAAITIAYFEHDVIVHAKMFIYIHILFLFSIHGISHHHHHHLLPQWSNVNMSASRSVTASNFLYWQKNHASSFLYAFVNMCVFECFALWIGKFCEILYIKLIIINTKHIKRATTYFLYSYCRKKPFSLWSGAQLNILSISVGWLIIWQNIVLFLLLYCTIACILFSNAWI